MNLPNFVRVTLDPRFEHAVQILERLRSSTKTEDHGSTPWMAIIAPDGHVLITSDTEKGNIGYPGEEGGRAQWEKMLRAGRHKMSDAEITGLLAALK